MNYQLASKAWNTTFDIAEESYVIFCVGLDESRVEAFRAWTARHAIPVLPLLGCYQTQTESSFAITVTMFHLVSRWTNGQESILWLGQARADSSRPAVLLFSDEHTEDLGFFVQCDRDTAEGSAAWTHDPATGAYFICI